MTMCCPSSIFPLLFLTLTRTQLLFSHNINQEYMTLHKSKVIESNTGFINSIKPKMNVGGKAQREAQSTAQTPNSMPSLADKYEENKTNNIGNKFGLRRIFAEFPPIQEDESTVLSVKSSPAARRQTSIKVFSIESESPRSINVSAKPCPSFDIISL